jgi:Gas vesicle synthesis protein GvpO
VADSTRRQAERRRAGRERRRSMAAEPLAELDDAAGQEGSGDRSEALDAAKRAAATAAAAALAGALGAGARALLQRRSADDRPDTEETEQDDGDETDQTPASSAPSTPEQEPEEDDESEEEEPRMSRQEDDAPDTDPQSEPEPARNERRTEPSEPQHGAADSEVAKVLERARNHVQDVLGEEPESVTGIERSNGSWSVMLEVVELHRVPDTTDVLGSYEVVVDDDGDLVRLERTRRYLRSQVEELS